MRMRGVSPPSSGPTGRSSTAFTLFMNTNSSAIVPTTCASGMAVNETFRNPYMTAADSESKD